jgi:hypothetical protein
MNFHACRAERSIAARFVNWPAINLDHGGLAQHARQVTTYREIFRIRDFRALFTALSTATAGKTMEVLAVSALVYLHTGSPLLAAMAYLGSFLPQAVGAMTLLSFADRLSPRAALSGWTALHAGVAAVLAMGLLPVWAILVVLMTLGLGDSVVSAINNSLVVDVVPEGGYVLGRSVLNIAVGAMQIIGYSAGGLLLAMVSPAGALWAASAVGLLTATIFRFGLRRWPARSTGRASISATWAGNRALLGNATIRRVLLGLWLPTGLIVGVEAMFVPYAGTHAGALFTAAAASMLLGDLVIGRWTQPRARSRLGLPLYVLLATPYLAFALHPGLVMATVLVVLASFGYAGALTLQERLVAAVPEHLLGQAMGLAGSGQATGQAVSAVAVGAVAELTMPSVAMTLAAATSLLTTLALLARPWPAASPVAPAVPAPTEAA